MSFAIEMLEKAERELDELIEQTLALRINWTRHNDGNRRFATQQEISEHFANTQPSTQPPPQK